jgi:hypothetical protein
MKRCALTANIEEVLQKPPLQLQEIVSLTLKPVNSPLCDVAL